MSERPHPGGNGAAAGATTRGMDSDLLADVRAGLSGPGPKRLPASLLYDELGTALFEAISALPEYGLTRADERILMRNASRIVRPLASPLIVAELGSGSGRKTRWILDALASRQTTPYFPIDISETALARCALVLGRLPAVRFEAVHADYLDGLRQVTAQRRPAHRLLLLFLGSTIGNFEPEAARAFLSEVRRTLKSGDALLLGTDLVKAPSVLIRAYDDPLGVTAAFNRNLLVRANRELGADFDVDRFGHRAVWNARESRIEMHLVSVRRQRVRVPASRLDMTFETGETIWTESSYKYRPDDVAALLERAEFRTIGAWSAAGFQLTLAEAV